MPVLQVNGLELADLANLAFNIVTVLITIVAVFLTFRQITSTVEASRITRVNLEQQIEKNQQKIVEAESQLRENPESTKPAWDLARLTLEKYFDRNLTQVASIYDVSVRVLIAGFVVVLLGVVQGFWNPSQLGTAAITAGAGVLTEFIGATFLVIYRTALDQATRNLKTLERINSVGMAMQILETMPDKVDYYDLRSKTKSSLVELLIKQVGAEQESAPEKGADATKK